MEVATKSASLLLASRDERLARAPEVGRQPNGLDGRRRLAGQVGEQALVGGAECLVRAARAKCQVPHGLALIDDRQADQRAGAGRVDRPQACCGLDFLLARPGAFLTLELDGDVRRTHRVGDALDECRQHRLRIERGLQPLTEPAERAVRVVPIPEHEPVHPALEPVMKRERDDSHSAS